MLMRQVAMTSVKGWLYDFSTKSWSEIPFGEPWRHRIGTAVARTMKSSGPVGANKAADRSDVKTITGRTLLLDPDTQEHYGVKALVFALDTDIGQIIDRAVSSPDTGEFSFVSLPESKYIFTAFLDGDETMTQTVGVIINT